MDIPKFNTLSISGKKVLIAPLDWGLGHATRCIPIIHALLKRKNSVVIAATGDRKAILAAAFPEIPIVDLPDYDVRLSVSPDRFKTGFLRQWPRLWSVIGKEKKWLEAFCRKESIDLIISDNRYGLYHKKIHSVFVTHQLFISSGFGSRIDRWMMRFHFRLIGRFDECWVPDNAEPEKSLAGRLSHPPRPCPIPVTYLGLLSRFAGMSATNGEEHPKIDLLVLLSGPEPQRSEIENLILSQLKEVHVSVLLIRGLPDKGTADEIHHAAPPGTDRVQIVHQLPTAALKEAIGRAGTIVCRSGYSTLMDLIALGRGAVLIPTPGQPEQEYLAEYTTAKGWMSAQSQATFSIAEIVSGEKEQQRSIVAPGLKEDLFFDGELPAIILR